jgi:hypothetical protein
MSAPELKWRSKVIVVLATLGFDANRPGTQVLTVTAQANFSYLTSFGSKGPVAYETLLLEILAEKQRRLSGAAQNQASAIAHTGLEVKLSFSASRSREKYFS